MRTFTYAAMLLTIPLAATPPHYVGQVLEWKIPNKMDPLWDPQELQEARQALKREFSFLRPSANMEIALLAAYYQQHGLSISEVELEQYLRWEDRLIDKTRERLLTVVHNKEEMKAAREWLAAYKKAVSSREEQARVLVTAATISEHVASTYPGKCLVEFQDDVTPAQEVCTDFGLSLDPEDRWEFLYSDGYFQWVEGMEMSGQVRFDDPEERSMFFNMSNDPDLIEPTEGGRYITPPWRRQVIPPSSPSKK